MLDNAIPEHLRTERSKPVKTPGPDFAPPYPSYSVRFPEHAADLVMAIIGAQFKSEADADADADATAAAAAAQSKVTSFLTSGTNQPSFSEWASVTDNKGFYNLTAFAYWPSTADYKTWTEASGFDAWWQALQPEDHQHGWFLEVFLPTMERFETIFNTTTPEGSAHMRQGWSGEVQQHAYWGSMRDRLPLAQTDSLEGEKATADDFKASSQDTTQGRRIRVPGKKNLAVIRSGQDWLATTPHERQLYLDTMHPVLVKGMDFLRDQGDEVGCYSCRFMDIVDPSTRKTDQERTFGLAYFDDLVSLEKWCKEHPTHLAIFGGFHRYAKKLNNNLSLRVFHEVFVLEPEQQFFEYIGCHPGTGMLL